MREKIDDYSLEKQSNILPQLNKKKGLKEVRSITDERTF